jgi:transcriptional regulator with XRE-family HTH domain
VWVQPEEQRIVGECLAAARVRSGITQRDLADRLGKPQSFVSAYESGQRRVDVQEFIAITEALGSYPLKVFREVLGRLSTPERRCIGGPE